MSSLVSRYGAFKSWERTRDRSARTAPARRNAPGELEWHLARLDPALFADATDSQRLAAAEAGRRAYFAQLALKSAHVRRRGGDHLDGAA